MYSNIPQVKIGVAAVSRNCFPLALSKSRKAALIKACNGKGLPVCDLKTIIENEQDALKALDELKATGCNALLVFLGNFGPEGPETILAQKFDGPVMFYAAEEDDDLFNGRGDAYCGMLNAGYNIRLRGIKAYIPEYPVGGAKEAAEEIEAFVPIARALIGLKNLKIFTFGPRPYDFLACNAPIKPLYDIGVEIQENSELDLLVSYRNHEGDKRIASVVKDMEKELKEGNLHPAVLPRMAQFEITLLDWMEENLGASKFAAFADKCWPAFQTEFRFCPCYINSRLTSRLIPVSCEVDIYGALSEYIISCVTEVPPTLLDINNTVPRSLYESGIKGKFGYSLEDTFMGFHCGNTPSCHLVKPEMKTQLILKRILEPDKDADVTRGTLEGDIKPGGITFFRLQSTAAGELKSYVAEGEVLPVATKSFGGIGIFAIPEMGRFYRHVLVEKGYPHHGGVAFGKAGKPIYEVLKYLGIQDVGFNQPKNMLYKTENPFK